MMVAGDVTMNEAVNCEITLGATNPYVMALIYHLGSKQFSIYRGDVILLNLHQHIEL